MTILDVGLRSPLTGSFTNNNFTDGGTNRDFGEVVLYERWSLREVPSVKPLVSDHLSLTLRLVAYGRFHCIGA